MSKFSTLFVKQENGRYRPADVSETLESAAAILLCKLLAQKGDPLTSPNAAREFLRHKLSHLKAEVFAVIFMDNRHRAIAYEELFNGTIDGASVHPREVVRRVIENNAAAVMFAHNHPSGVAEPSQADLRITQRLKDALALIEVHVLDHLIVGETGITSFAERGLI
jgi:DNA repair protein RadC